ncbi:hypothetical protein FRC03_002326 [Tulasnella sp. 419]|nr:hypothetical protein FRC03_002326 [Tulasnella sp. 419]
MSIIIRPATSNDASSISEIYSYYVLSEVSTFETNPPSPSEILARLEHTRSNNLPAIVATTSSNPSVVIGYTMVRPYHTREAYNRTVELGMYVDRNYLKGGVGVALWEAVITILRSEEQQARRPVKQVIAAMSIDTEGLGIGVKNFYIKMGFREVGVLKDVGYKFDRYISVMFLQYSIEETVC